MMFNKRDFFRKLKKNKILFLVIAVIVVSVAYFCFEDVIDSFIFDSDVISEVSEDGADDEIALEDRNVDEDRDEGTGEKLLAEEGIVSADEVDLVMEESDDESEENQNNESNENANGESKGDGDESADKDKIYIYVTGEVNSPGVVILDEGSRIVDAINAVGGTTTKADISKVNLVYVLEDGMKVNIPNSNDLNNDTGFEYITKNSGDGASSTGEGSSSGGGVLNSSSSDTSSLSNFGIVNINTATQTELESLPGIGPSLALKIINYRKENGKFSSIEEIKNVSGIGDSKFESLKKYITV